eukprot:1502960-Pyramimonas_sp.AAC.2
MAEARAAITIDGGGWSPVAHPGDADRLWREVGGGRAPLWRITRPSRGRVITPPGWSETSAPQSAGHCSPPLPTGELGRPAKQASSAREFFERTVNHTTKSRDQHHRGVTPPGGMPRPGATTMGQCSTLRRPQVESCQCAWPHEWETELPA